MDQNSEGTPNPLNQVPEAVGPTNQAEQATPVAAPEPVAEPAPVAESAPAPEPVAEPAPAVESSADPMARPMEQAPVAEVKPAETKKKTGLIVGIIALFLIVGGGVATALLLLNSNKGDAVAMALQKLMEGNVGNNLSVDGTINLNVDDFSSIISDINVKLNANFVGSITSHSTNTSLTAKLNNGDDEVQIETNEIRTTSGDLYVKINGLSDALSTYSTSVNTVDTVDTVDTLEAESDDEEDCETDTYCFSGTTSSYDSIAMFAQYADIVESFEDEWIRISTEDGEQDISDITSDSSSCLVDLVSNLGNSSNSLSEIYKDNKFIVSSTDNLPIASKNNPIYRITVDEEKLTGFLDAAKGVSAIAGATTCLEEGGQSFDITQLATLADYLPTLYVEVDNDYRFTRLYFEINNDDYEVKVDLNFAYPENASITEPTEYQDLETILQNYSTPEEQDSLEPIVIEDETEE